MANDASRDNGIPRQKRPLTAAEMTTLNNVVLFVLVLFVVSFGLVGCGSSEASRTVNTSPARPTILDTLESLYTQFLNTSWAPRSEWGRLRSAPERLRAEREAYANLKKVVEAARPEPTKEWIGAGEESMHWYLQHAFRVFAVMASIREDLDHTIHTSRSGRLERGGARYYARYAEYLGQPTEAHAAFVNIASGLSREGSWQFETVAGELVLTRCTYEYVYCQGVLAAYQKSRDAHIEDTKAFFRALQEGIDVLLQAAEVLLTIIPTDAVRSSSFQNLRSAIQSAKQQSLPSLLNGRIVGGWGVGRFYVWDPPTDQTRRRCRENIASGTASYSNCDASRSSEQRTEFYAAALQLVTRSLVVISDYYYDRTVE